MQHKHLELGSRDPRIDFFRGLALYMIFVDHVPGDPLSRITFHAIGFSDAAEIFVFISGLSCGIAYSRVLARKGWSALFSSITKRAARIYIYYALSSGAIILLATAAAFFWQWDYEVLAGPQQLPTILSVLFLISPPALTDILVLYIGLTLINVPAFLIAGERLCALALGISALIWVLSQVFSEFMAPLTNAWQFNPFAWQFLFSIGIFVGLKWDSRQPVLPSLAQHRWILVVACTVVISAFTYKLFLFVSSRFGFDVAWLRIGDTWNMKANLSAIRILHFLSVAFLVAIYFRRDSALFKSLIAMPVIKAGRHSLEVYSLTVVLCVAAGIVVLVGTPSLRDWLLIDGIGFLSMVLLATALEQGKRTRALQSSRAL
jgi:hypothetical protein